MPALDLVLWNTYARRRAIPAGRGIQDILLAQAPDIICLTEAHRDLLEGGALDGGHLIACELRAGASSKPVSRKVLLWSRAPWDEVDTIGHPDLPRHRFVRGATNTPLGRLTVIGVCIPYDECGMATEGRARWEEHQRYLTALDDLLHRQPPNADTLLLGDFNQKIPRTHAPLDRYDQLMRTLAPFQLATAGTLPGFDVPPIDHLAHSHDLRVSDVRALPNSAPGIARLSDHVGLRLRVVRADGATQVSRDQPMR